MYLMESESKYQSKIYHKARSTIHLS
jgi:hypothetical protein